jgi:hypothetical protein
MICTKCKLDKGDNFSSSSKWCRPCRAAWGRQYRRSKREHFSKPEKYCPNCKQTKIATEFNINSLQSDGLYPWCKKCRSQRSKSDYEGPVKKNTRYLKTYNISLDEYNNKLQEQDGKCCICKNTCDRTLSVDHDRSCCSDNKSCGKCIRGLLCRHCNLLLGNAKDKIETLKSAIEYLETHNLRMR